MRPVFLLSHAKQICSCLVDSYSGEWRDCTHQLDGQQSSVPSVLVRRRVHQGHQQQRFMALSSLEPCSYCCAVKQTLAYNGSHPSAAITLISERWILDSIDNKALLDQSGYIHGARVVQHRAKRQRDSSVVKVYSVLRPVLTSRTMKRRRHKTASCCRPQVARTWQSLAHQVSFFVFSGNIYGMQFRPSSHIRPKTGRSR